MTPEAKVKKAVKKMLDDRGAYYFMPATGGYGRSGVPDIVACFNSIFIGIECKSGSNKPTALQEAELRKISAVGVINLNYRATAEINPSCRKVRW